MYEHENNERLKYLQSIRDSDFNEEEYRKDIVDQIATLKPEYDKSQTKIKKMKETRINNINMWKSEINEILFECKDKLPGVDLDLDDTPFEAFEGVDDD